MTFSQHIILSDETARAELQAFEERLASLSLGENIANCQELNELTTETSMAKLLLLALEGGDEIKHEVKRIVAWKHRKTKADFFIAQLPSTSPEIVLLTVGLLGVLKEPAAIPYLDALYLNASLPLAKALIEALSELDGAFGTKTIVAALRSAHRELTLLALTKLCRRVDQIPWKVFQPLLSNADAEIRSEAFFAITIRKNATAARVLLAALHRETERSVSQSMLKHLATVPSTRLIYPLLTIIVHGADQKARLIAGRTLDRLQGTLHPNALYRYRLSKDIAIRTEILFRLGKFGSDSTVHKEYLRRTLQEHQHPLIRQACLQALGAIAERKDVDFLITFLHKDPLTSYNAAMALTKLLRLEDSNRVLLLLHESHSQTIKQIFLRHLIRRRGFQEDPIKLLHAAHECLHNETNINVRYLAYGLLQFAPDPSVVDFLLHSYTEDDNAFERESINHALQGLAQHHGTIFLTLAKTADDTTCTQMICYLPKHMDAAFYQSLAETLYVRFAARIEDREVEELFRSVFIHLLEVPEAIREFMRLLPNSAWRELFLRTITEIADRARISNLQEELTQMLADPQQEVRALAMMLLLSLKDASIVPSLVAIAERDPKSQLRSAAQFIASTLVKEGVL